MPVFTTEYKLIPSKSARIRPLRIYAGFDGIFNVYLLVPNIFRLH